MSIDLFIFYVFFLHIFLTALYTLAAVMISTLSLIGLSLSLSLSLSLTSLSLSLSQGMDVAGASGAD
jgi:hypothetical protein